MDNEAGYDLIVDSVENETRVSVPGGMDHKLAAVTLEAGTNNQGSADLPTGMIVRQTLDVAGEEYATDPEGAGDIGILISGVRMPSAAALVGVVIFKSGGVRIGDVINGEDGAALTVGTLAAMEAQGFVLVQ